MTDLRDLIRTQVRDVIREEISKAVRAELGAALPLTPNPGILVVPKAKRAKIIQQYPTGTVLRVNQTSNGPDCGQHSKLMLAWRAIKTHMGLEEFERGKLSKEIQIVCGYTAGTASAYVTRLTQLGCLMVVPK